MSAQSNANSNGRTTGAHLLVESLIGHGIDTAFGVPGDTGVNVYDVLADSQDSIRHILALDERDAGYMADAYARTSRKLAVAEASSGAGAVYLASGLAESYASGIPMLAITTDIHRSSRGSGAITEIDQVKLFSAVTKKQIVAEAASEIPALVSEAVSTALSGRPGPVALICPEDVLDEHTDETASSGSNVIDVSGELPQTTSLDEAAQILENAKNPVALVGGGIHMSGAWGELREFAEHLAMPVTTTIHGKSAFPEDHQLALGVGGGNGSRGYALELIDEADVVLIVGSRANSTDTNGFTAPPREGKQIIQIDIDADRAGKNFPGSVVLIGDAKSTLDELRKRTQPASETELTRRSAQIEQLRNAWRKDAEKPLPPLEEGTLQPKEIVKSLHQIYGAEAWVAADPGTPTPNLSAYWDTDGEGWRVVIPRGHGPMGYSISAAIGMAVAHPGERVLCLTTEGSLAMGIADWETSVRLNLPITYVVLDNTSFAWIKMLQHLFMEKRYFHVEPGPIDPVLLAKGMGLPGSHPRSLGEFETAAKEALNSDGPVVIHVRVPEHHLSPPPVAPWQRALENPDAGRPVY